MSDAKAPLCTDCRHYRARMSGDPICAAAGATSLIDGSITSTCSEERFWPSFCGKTGKNFQPRLTFIEIIKGLVK